MQFIDHLILGLYLAALVVITWKFRKSSGNARDFFLAGRSIGALPVGLSVMVTTFSAVNYLALPGEVFQYGLYVLASFPAFFLAAWPVTRYWMPFFRKQRHVSIYAFLERRFDVRIRILSSLLFLVWRMFWMATALYASCRIMSILTGWNFLGLVLLCGIAAALYSAIGGMKAVIWTDVMQFGVLLGSIGLALYLAARGTGFWHELFAADKLKPFVPWDVRYLSFDPSIRITLWSGLLGTFVAFLTRFGADQMVMQRYLAASSLTAARRGLWINGIASVTALSLLALFGLAIAVFAGKNHLLPELPPIKVIAILLTSFPPGATGMVAAGLLAATMSSMDSGLNSCTAAITTDFQNRFGWEKISPGSWTLLLTIPILLGAGWLLPELNDRQTLFAILNKLVNTIGTPLLGIMLCALFFKKIHANSVFYGALGGIVLTIVSGWKVQNLSLHYYAVLSLVCTLGMMLLFDFAFRRKRR